MTEILDIPPKKMEAYRRIALRKSILEKEQVVQRRERAWELAREAASLLKERFGASRVVAFGSLVHEDGFTRWSDVDIAAWELRPEDTFRAMGAVWALSRDIEINLVDIRTGHPGLVEAIEREGIDL